MSAFKETVKNTLPAPVYNVLRESRDALVRGSMWPLATFHPMRRDSIARMAALRDKHRGKRCFLIGNGPSLKQTDLSRLKDEFTLGTNRIYLAFPDIGFSTSYYLSVNDLVIEQSAHEIQELAMPRFISWRGRKWIRPEENVYFIHTTYTGEKFAKDVRGRVWEGGTVTYTALQVAYYLGFEQVILVGVDHNYVSQGKPNETVVSQGDDPNHFHPGYFGKGYRWQLPDLVQWEDAYRLARRTFEASGRTVVDATIGGKLRVFPRVEYDSLF